MFKRFSKKTRLLLLLTGACLLAIQFIRPEIGHPPVTGDLEAPPEIKAILERACYDCHSNETKLRWYDQLAPAYWRVAAHVREGREVLNFSAWQSLPPAVQKGKLFESYNQVQAGAMPLADYQLVHPSAKITPAELALLKNYVGSLVSIQPADSAAIAGADKQYRQWTAGALQPGQVQNAPNGIGYIPDYRNWQVVTISDRFDNGTMRVIYGNDIAMKAIRENRTNPWPNGTIFAKAAWKELQDADGQVRTGEFWQVEFMIKDDKKYADTKGWGWARWRGPQLAPYGKHLLFTTECVNCHRPMKDKDYVFTIPTTLPAFQFSEKGLKVITSSIDRKQNTMSTLYGNQLAFDHAAEAMDTGYPTGAELTLVTWRQREDPHWFGANIPGTPQSVEVVQVAAPATYRQYAGAALAPVPNTDTLQVNARIKYILAQKPSVIP
ncbi:cytochrome P460 family protein [Chitinophaga japonensis]|uniref:Cytochrome P460 n=1 Tax=Chitinophaga japonensis TaxID=104662 RepID=A0A562T4N8_CHIJA|nr:cytochrome P460 family protein [Chitinophaga japonensis]TWI88472.1 cytochrome P460 [Chitinophaga japonensis]